VEQIQIIGTPQDVRTQSFPSHREFVLLIFVFFLLLRQTISHDDFLFAIALWYYFIVLRW
jgi:hypothetical protein